MTRFLLVVLGIAGAALTGCSTPSLNPLASDDKVVTEPGIVGTWVPEKKDDGDDPEEKYIIGADEAKSYTLKLTKKDEPAMQFSMQLVKLGEHTFVDMTIPHAAREELGEKYGTTIAPMHNFIKVKLDKDELTIWALDDEWLATSLKNGTVKLAHAEYGEDKKPVLTASTADLQAFFNANGSNDKLFNGPSTLRREGAAKTQPAKKPAE